MDTGGVSKSDIDFDFDHSDSGSDISIATNASSLVDQFEQSMALNDINGEVYESRLRGDTEDSDDFGPPIVVPLKTGSDHSDGEAPIDAGSRSSRGSRRSKSRSGSFNRRPPGRTKSGEGMSTSAHSVASGRRRPPPRTKSGSKAITDSDDDEGNIRRRPPRRTKSGSSHGIRRRPPNRTKSGKSLRGGSGTGSEDESAEDDSEDFVADLPDDSSFEEASPTSPCRRAKSDGREDMGYREKALRSNMARRQRSSDMLGAMREATRNAPSRSRSDIGILNGRRRGTGRTNSSGFGNDAIDSLASPGRKPLRRRAPPRTKSGSGNQIPSPPLQT